MLKMELPGMRKRGRPKRFMDVVKDMQAVGAAEEDAEDGKEWKQMDHNRQKKKNYV